MIIRLRMYDLNGKKDKILIKHEDNPELEHGLGMASFFIFVLLGQTPVAGTCT